MAIRSSTDIFQSVYCLKGLFASYGTHDIVAFVPIENPLSYIDTLFGFCSLRHTRGRFNATKFRSLHNARSRLMIYKCFSCKQFLNVLALRL